MLFEDLKNAMDKGRAGDNKGLSTGSAKIDTVINGIKRATYYLLGGNLGTGKTAFADHCFILMPLYYIVTHPESKIKLRVFYRSMEIPRDEKLAKWAAHVLFHVYGIITHPEEILSVNKYNCSQELYDKVMEARGFIDSLLEYIIFFDRSVNPTGVYMDVKRYMDANGKEEERIKIVKGQEFKYKIYIPNDKDEIVLSVADHIGLLRGEYDKSIEAYLSTKKQIIDKWSGQAVDLRNHYGVSTLGISQFNRDMADMDRKRFSELTPQLEDFKDTGNASEDANIVGTIFNPLRYGLAEYGNMNINQLGGRYRSISWLKNRYGSDMIKINQNFLGESGYFRDFPDPLFPERHYRQAKEYTKFT